MTLLSTLLVAMAGPAPAHAERVRVGMKAPRMVDADTARLKGRVTGRDTVVIQRYAAGKKRWVGVKRVRVSNRGIFRTGVRATGRAVRYRAAAGRVKSRSRLVKTPTPTIAPDPAPVPSDACGPQPLKADGTRWSCTLADDFDGITLDSSIWTPQTVFEAGSPAGMPCYIDDPSVISVHDGALHLSVRQVPKPLDCPGLQGTKPTAHVAGMVSTYRLFSQQYGRFEAMFKNTATTVPGLHEAFWLWPDDRSNTAIWPAAGEIDIVETYSQYPDLAIPFLHYTHNDNGGPIPGTNTAWNCQAKRGEFNTYTLEWTANRLEILVNGKTCLVNTSGDPAFHKPYIVALTQALGTATNAYDGRAPLPATMTVDYVKVWE